MHRLTQIIMPPATMRGTATPCSAVATSHLARVAGAIAIVMLSGVPANAAVLLTGAGVWDHQTVVTPVGAPDTSWSFSFRLPDIIAANPTVEATGFEYRLGNESLAMTLDAVEFFPSGAGGLFDLFFTLNGEAGRLQLGGPLTDVTGGLDRPDVGSDLSLRLGTFDAELGSVEPIITRGVGVGTVTLTALPEPATWAMMVGGFTLVGLRRRRLTTVHA